MHGNFATKVCVGHVTEVDLAADGTLRAFTCDCEDDDTVDAGVTTSTNVLRRDFDSVKPITDGFERRSLCVRTRFASTMPATDADRANVGNGMKRRTAGWTAMMALRHGPSALSDTGLREMTNKELQRSYKNTNKNPDHYPRTMAANTEREDKLMLHKRRLQADVPASSLQQPRYTASQQSDVRLTGRGLPSSGTHYVNVDPAEMQAFGTARDRYDAGAIEFHLSDEATWGGLAQGSAHFSANMLRATGTYDDVVAAPTEVNWDFHQCLAQSGKPVEWMLVQVEQAKLTSRLMWTGDEGDTWTSIADVVVRKSTGVVSVSFKHVSRKHLTENELLHADADEARGTAKVAATAEASFLGPPDAPASAAPAGLPRGLAELVSRHPGTTSQRRQALSRWPW